MCHRLSNYLEEFKILYPLQVGFREKCSTTRAVISITEFIRQPIANNEFGCGIFIDLKKAFDIVNYIKTQVILAFDWFSLMIY